MTTPERLAPPPSRGATSGPGKPVRMVEMDGSCAVPRCGLTTIAMDE